MKLTLTYLFFLFNLVLLGQTPTAPKTVVKTYDISRGPQYGDTIGVGKILSKLTIPDSVKNGLVSGHVRIDLQIDTSGNIIGQTIMGGCLECKKEAIKLIKLMPRFIPAIKDGKKVNGNFYLPLSFQSDPESTLVYKPDYIVGVWTIQSEGKLQCPECPSIIFYKNQTAKLISDTLNWEIKDRTLTLTNKSKPTRQIYFLNNSTYSIVFSKYFKVLTVESDKEKYILYKH